ncbi:coiled-coil domain-containing protein 162-like [Alosa pseudoharengus]|uniref:coiled-coil domain-containing protein 162-like n=1 Tax=Alosa pseudoharengus TaxID=34774 RepID=UPI003F8A81F2
MWLNSGPCSSQLYWRTTPSWTDMSPLVGLWPFRSLMSTILVDSAFTLGRQSCKQLLYGSGIENLQVTLACQVTQKNTLISAIKQASLCYWAEVAAGSQQVQHESRHPEERSPSSKAPRRYASDSRHRLAESFVSIQLEKTRPRDEMLNAFIKRREATGTLLQNTDEAAKTKRKLILEFCSKLSVSMSQCCVRAQIVALYHSLTLLLQDFPTICQTHFMMGRSNEAKSNQDSEKALTTDPRMFQQRPRALLSADGTVLLNLWFLPHYTETLLMFRGLEEKHMLAIASALHDIVCYTISFARLGNAASLLSSASQSTLTADWGGTESISAELWDIQLQVDCLCDPRSPKAVGHLLQLRRQVLFLLFDAATRHTIRKTFLSTGNTAAYHSVNDNMGHALPLLSDSLRKSDQSYQLPLPQPLEPGCPQAQRLFPWRWFMLCHGLHPLDVWDVPPIEFCMQLCLSGLGERSRQVANGELLGVSLQLEEVLSSGQAVGTLQLDMTAQATDDVQRNKTQEPEECVVAEADGDCSVKRPRDPTFGLEQQRGFLLLWKQLETLKEIWGCHRLGVQHIHSPTHYQHFTTLYSQEIQYPSMKALAQHLGSEREYEALLVDGQPLPPPAGASEVELRTWELLRLLESMECDMIKAVQWKMAKETTLLLSERTRQDTALPTDVWKRGPMKHCPTPERPLIVENFVHQLLSGVQNSEGQVSFSSAHLQQCLSALSRDVIGRERSNFLFYSQFYEHLLQQETQLLHQREQDVKNLEEYHIQSSDPLSKAAALCRGLMVEMTALRAQLAHVEEERNTLQQQLRAQHRLHYDTLVQRLFTTCLQLKSRLDGYHQKMEEDVLQMVGRARREGVERISRLQKKYGSSREPEDLAETLVQKKAQQDLLIENSQQRALMRKLQALGQWREAVAVGKLQRELHSTKQRELQRQLACVRVQLESEQQGALLQQELEALREVMQHSQKEVHLARKQLSQKSQRLQEVEHGGAQEERMRMQLHSSGALGLQRLQEEAEDRERVIKELTKQLHTGRRHSQLQLQHSSKELQQVRSKLQQERGLKQEAFQLVSQLQRQVSAGTALPSCTSTPGLVAGRSSRTSPILFLRNSRGSSSGMMARKLRRDDTEDSGAEVLQSVNTDTKMVFSKSKQSLSQLRLHSSEALLPNLTDGRSSPLLLTLQRP